MTAIRRVTIVNPTLNGRGDERHQRWIIALRLQDTQARTTRSRLRVVVQRVTDPSHVERVAARGYITFDSSVGRDIACLCHESTPY